MTSETSSSVLRRMTAEAHAPKEQPSVKAMVSLALEQASERALRLPLDVTADAETCVARAALGGCLPTSALFAVLEGQVPGFMAMESALVGAIVEHMTIGRILPGSETGRTPTRVDAALVAPLIDGALRGATEAMQMADVAPWGQGLAFGAMLAEARSLLLALPVRSYHVFSFDVSLGGGQREGKLTLGFGELPEPETPPDDASEKRAGATVRAGVLSAPAVLDAVIARISVPLRELQTLKLGDTLAIPADALGRARLEARGTDHAIRVGLGQLNGFRAVRLREGGARGTEPQLPGERGHEGPQKTMAPAQEKGPAAHAEEPVALPAVAPVDPAVPGAGPDDLDALLELAETGTDLAPVST